MIGYALGGSLSFALMIVSAVIFLPRGISPQFLGTPALAAEHAMRQAGGRPATRIVLEPEAAYPRS